MVQSFKKLHPELQGSVEEADDNETSQHLFFAHARPLPPHFMTSQTPQPAPAPSHHLVAHGNGFPTECLDDKSFVVRVDNSFRVTYCEEQLVFLFEVTFY